MALEGGGLEAYDLLTGTRAWHLDITAAGPLAVSDEHLFFGAPDSLSAVDAKSGTTAWRADVAGYAGGPLAFGEGLLLGVVGPQSVGAFRARDGQMVWRRDFDAGIHTAPSLALNRAYVSLDDGRLLALDAGTGEPVWTRKLGGAPNEVLAVEDRLYVGSDDNFLYCLFARDGSTNWRWRTGGDVIGAPLSDGERVYFVSKDNVVRGLDRHSGAQRWKRALAGRPTRGVVGIAGVVLASGIAPRVWGFSMKDGTPAGDVTAVGELASQPYVETLNAIPWLFFASRDISAGARLQAFKRNLEPPLNTPLTAIPGSITVPQSNAAPVGSSSEPAGPGAGSGGAAPPQPR